MEGGRVRAEAGSRSLSTTRIFWLLLRRWWTRRRAATRRNRCAGRAAAPLAEELRAAGRQRADGERFTVRATACRPTGKRWKATSILTGMRNSSTSTGV